MPLQKFLAKLPPLYTEKDREKFSDAFAMAEEAHGGQTRASGQPYVSHCEGVAEILVDMQASPNMIIAGILHDVLVDSKVSLETVKNRFGNTVAHYVEDLARITSLPQLNRGDQHEEERQPLPVTEDISDSRKVDLIAETLRKMLLAIGDDVRVVIIKLADRLHNLRTLHHLPPDRQKKIAQETLDIFAPLANRLGIWQIKWEMEDLAFRYSNPEKYQEISTQLEMRRNRREDEINGIVTTLQKLLKAADVEAQVTGRPKHIYSIYRKMQRKGQNFEAIRDLRAVRALVNDEGSCYKVLGIVHMHYTPIPGEFDDYIANAKPNNYQSLHTAVIYSDGKPVEVQIRTYEMHQNAEYGVAAHWRYKETKARMSSDYEQKVTAMRSLLAWSQEVDESSELLENLRSDPFRDKVYALTPKGDVVELPLGATPIDFAYQVHTQIGHRCRGAKVNGKLVTLDYTLQTGDQVEVLTTSKGGPSRDWLNANLGMVKSPRSRSKIKQWFKQQDRDQNLEHGKAALEREFKRLNLNTVDLLAMLETFNVRSLDDLYVAIGTGDLSMGRVINKVSELQKSAITEDLLIPAGPTTKPAPSSSVMVMGLKGMATVPARCCNPMPGDDIVGYVTRGRGATIHRVDCPNILRVHDRERLIQVDWASQEKTYPVALQLSAYDRQGLMTDISTVLSGENVRLVDLSMQTRAHLVKVNLVLEVSGISQLSRLLTRMENIPNVIEASRSKPG